MGQGIYLIHSEDDLRPGERDVVIQKYMSRPLLVDGYKFDLRIYVLVTCVDPLCVYVFNEGLARFATLKYEAPHSHNMSDQNMHLTNYSVNKHSDRFEHSDADNEGTKRALSAVLRDLAYKGYDTVAVWDKICDVIVRSIIPIQPSLAHTYHSAFTNGPNAARLQSKDVALPRSCCFELLGFDIIFFRFA